MTSEFVIIKWSEKWLDKLTNARNKSVLIHSEILNSIYEYNMYMYVHRLIRNKKGPEVVQKILEISEQQRNLKQNSLLFAYALCARSNDKDTKQAAYSVISRICRIPTHLFMFIKFCEEESKQEGQEG